MQDGQPKAGRAGRAERAWVIACAAGFAFMAGVYLSTSSPAVHDQAYSVVTLPVLALSASLAAWRARRGLKEERLAWALVAAGGFVWFVGDAGWMWIAVVQHHDVPSPHWTDAFYLANTPLMVAGVLALAWRRGSRHGGVQALDALLMAGGLFVAAWLLVGPDLMTGAGPGPLGLAVTLAYPVGDIAIVAACSLAVSRLDAARRRQLAPLLAGLVVIAVADAGYAVDVLQRGSYAPTLFDLGWGLGAAGIGWAALRPAVPATVRTGPPSRFEEYASTLLLLPALLVALVQVMRGRAFDSVAMAVGLATGAILLARQALFLDTYVRLSRRLMAASHLAGLGSWSTDRHGRLGLDDEALRLAGLEATRPATLAHLVDRLDPEHAPELLHAIESLPPSASMERSVRPAGADGDRALQVRVTRHADGRLHGTLLDISAEVRLEAQRAEVARLAEVAKAKAAFINTAAHELNTPLTPIRLSLANLRSGKARGDPLSLLDRNVERLTRLLHDVLEGARLQSDRLRLDRHNMDLAALVREAVEEHQPQAQAHGVHLEAQADAPVPVVGDPGRLHEVVMNLLSNALKFTPKDGHVRARVEAQADGQAHVLVEDDGAGISGKDIPLLFQPFTQVGAPHEGTGLGLYICRGVVETHGGHITVSSPGEGLGSRFEVTLPLAPEGAIPAA